MLDKLQTIDCSVIEDDSQKAQLIDARIRLEIEKATDEDSSVWTCPDYNRREYMRSFFSYPAMMVPAVQKKLIDIVTAASPEIKNMLDPFMGSSTTLVACMENGLNCYGLDINPLAVLISKVRTGPYQVELLRERHAILMSNIKADSNEQIEANFKGLYKWFKPNVALELSRIVRSIRLEEDINVRRFFWVILAETIRVTSNDRTSTYKMHMRKLEDIEKRNYSTIKVFDLHVDKSIDDLKSHADLINRSGQLTNGVYNANITTLLWDSKSGIYNPGGQEFYDLLVTSPPYGDNKTTVTYGQHSYLPLQWIDLHDIDENVTTEYLKTTSQIDTISLGGKISEVNMVKFNELLLISPSLEITYSDIINRSPDKVKKVIAFILDLNETLDNIFKVMKKNSYQIWTLGNRNVAGVEIPNDQIVTELMENKGCKAITKVSREIVSKRMAKRNRSSSLMNTEDILIFRKIG